MKYFEINADGNALILLKVDGENIEVLNAMDGYGDNIKDKTTIKEIKTTKDKAIGLFCDFLKKMGKNPSSRNAQSGLRKTEQSAIIS